MKSSALNW